VLPQRQSEVRGSEDQCLRRGRPPAHEHCRQGGQTRRPEAIPGPSHPAPACGAPSRHRQLCQPPRETQRPSALGRSPIPRPRSNGCICIGAAAARHVAHRVGSASGRVAFALIIDCAGGLQNCGGALPVRPVTSSLESGRRESMKLPKRKHLHGIPWEAQAKVAVKARTKAASTRTRGCRCPATPRRRWSGRPESNRRRPAWEAGILPLNYARVLPRSLVSRPGAVNGPHRLEILVPARG
jgi:hypothetical protein